MPRAHKSVIKRAKQDQGRKLRNQAYKARVAGATKKVLAHVAASEKEKALAELKSAQAIIDGAASKGIMHRNTVSRRVSRIARQVAKLKAK